MKCIACGREMVDRGTHYECSNILCDYEEAIEPGGTRMKMAISYEVGLLPASCLSTASRLTMRIKGQK